MKTEATTPTAPKPASQWDKRETESTKAFAAFQTYLGMGDGRSLELVAQKSAKSRPLMKRWCRRHDWVARTAAYEAHLAAQRHAGEAQAAGEVDDRWKARREAAAEEDFLLGMELRKRAREMMAFPLAERTVTGENGQVTIIKPTKWTLRDAARLAETGTKLVRLSAGMATDRTEVTGLDGEPIDVREVGDDLSADEIQKIAERVTQGMVKA